MEQRRIPEGPAFPHPTPPEEQAAETDEPWLVMVGPATQLQLPGAALWAVFGAIAGAVLGILLALIPFAGLTLLARLILVGGIGLLAGATAGFIYGGGRDAEAEPREAFGELRARRNR